VTLNYGGKALGSSDDGYGIIFTLVSRLDDVVLVDTTLTGKSSHDNIKMRL